MGLFISSVVVCHGGSSDAWHDKCFYPRYENNYAPFL